MRDDSTRRSAYAASAVEDQLAASFGWWADHRSPTLALMAQAAASAARFGHRLTPWERDGHYSSVAWCAACGLAAAVDTSDGERYIGGSTTRAQCTGQPGAEPAWDEETTW